MAGALNAAEEYRSALAELTCNNKTQINLLTILAEDYKEYAAEIVDVIADHITNVPKEQKLPVLYVADSILKNVRTDNDAYKQCFTKHIVNVFLHIFKEGDERIRLSMYNLRKTWPDLFPRSKLYQLDLKVHEVDRAWPVPTPPSASSAAPSVSKVHLNPKFLHASSNAQPAATTRTRPTTSLASTSGNGRAQASGPAPPKRRVIVKTESEEVKRQASHRPVKKQQRDVLDDIMSLPPVVKNEPRESTPPPGPNAQKRRTIDHEEHPPHKSRRAPQHQHQDMKPSRIQIQPTAALGAHAFVSAPRLPSPSLVPAIVQPMPHHPPHATFQMPPPGLPPKTTTPHPSMSIAPPIMGHPGTHLPPPGFMGYPPVSGAHPFSQGHPPSYPPPPLSQGGPPPHSGPTFVDPHTRPIHHQPPPPVTPAPAEGQVVGVSTTSVPPPGPSTSAPSPPAYPSPPIPAATPAPRSHVISNDTVKLEGIPANNRIFVDGKAHEVIYIGETAVIERNGLPHRIYFSGTPRNVVIDGMVHELKFGEKKTVLIDGEEHSIRFGAPSRELYMGDFPFKGAFGGPPIYATINGIRHEIRLGGPAPEVKIEPQPSHDLNRFMSQARGQKPAARPTQPEPEQAPDLQLLLKKLVNSGFINRFGSKENEPPRKSSPPVEVQPRQHPIANKSLVERRSTPTSALKEFMISHLRTRYDSVIAALHEKRKCCSQCGLRLEHLMGDRLKRHMDWHVKKNLRLLDDVSKSRAWYLDAEDWVETDDVDDEDLEQKKKVEVEPEEVMVDIAQTESRLCASCELPFTKVFDEEDDVWQLADCVMHNGKTYHSKCMVDATMTEEPETSAPAEDVLASSPSVNIKMETGEVAEVDMKPNFGGEF